MPTIPKFALAQLMALGLSPPEMVRLAANAGFDIAMLKPNTDVTPAIQVVVASARPNGGVLLDALHFDRSDSRIEDIARIPSGAINHWQLCEGPREKPTTTEGLPHAACAERMFPGEGGIDLVSLVRAIPADVPITPGIPTAELARTVGPLERARQAVARTHELLARAAAEQVP